MVWGGEVPVQSADYVVLRAIEVALGAAVVVALAVSLNSGLLASGAQKFSDWYASQVDGMLSVTVVSTVVTLPQVERTDLPIPQDEPTAFSASEDEVKTPASLASD
jgi:hypothetical protein